MRLLVAGLVSATSTFGLSFLAVSGGVFSVDALGSGSLGGLAASVSAFGISARGGNGVSSTLGTASLALVSCDTSSLDSSCIAGCSYTACSTGGREAYWTRLSPLSLLCSPLTIPSTKSSGTPFANKSARRLSISSTLCGPLSASACDGNLPVIFSPVMKTRRVEARSLVGAIPPSVAAL